MLLNLWRCLYIIRRNRQRQVFEVDFTQFSAVDLIESPTSIRPPSFNGANAEPYGVAYTSTHKRFWTPTWLTSIIIEALCWYNLSSSILGISVIFVVVWFLSRQTNIGISFYHNCTTRNQEVLKIKQALYKSFIATIPQPSQPWASQWEGIIVNQLMFSHVI